MKSVIINVILSDRDITNQSGVTFMGHIDLGMELNFRDHFFLRGGWRGGYFSGGIGIKNNGAELSLGAFTQEIGTQYMGQGDTRYMLQYKVRAF